MSTQAPSAAPDVAVNPKIATEVKSFVSWDVKVQGQKAEKLKGIRELLASDAKKGISKKMLNATLTDAGMDAPLASTLLSLVFPASDEIAKEILKADRLNEQHGDDKTKNVGFNKLAQIARGKLTVKEVQEKKAETGGNKRPARPQGNAPQQTEPKLTLPKAEQLFRKLCGDVLAANLPFEEFATQVDEVCAEFAASEEKKKS